MSTVADSRREAPSLRCGRPRAGATLGDRKRAAEGQQDCFALPKLRYRCGSSDRLCAEMAMPHEPFQQYKSYLSDHPMENGCIFIYGINHASRTDLVRYSHTKSEFALILIHSPDTTHHFDLRATKLRSMSPATQHLRIVIVTIAPTETNSAYITMVGDIVSAYISNNHVAAAELPALIASVHAALNGLVNGTVTSEVTEPKGEKPTPAQIRKSVTRDAIFSFIDGKGYKTLKRHLTVHGLTPDTYRARFGLPSDYPMVTAAYSEVRSGLAKSLGLGVQSGRLGRSGKAAA